MTLSETRERFLKAILAHVPAASIEEIHFFAPIRQSGVEGGVAVVAATEVTPVAPNSPDSPAAPDTPAKFAVFTARYRYVLKGPDRGKWDCQVQVEADAPLVTVDAVVRGVQRRSGDADEPERMSGDDVRAFAESFA